VAVLSLVVVATLFVTALFAPTMAATPVDRTETHADLQQLPLTEPNDSAQLTYFDEEAGEVRTSSVGLANMQVESEGTPETNVGPLSYDRYDRFHPFGTTFSGTDLYSEMVVGARVYAVVGGLGAVVVTGIAVALALVASRVRGRIEGAIEGLASVVAALPQLLVLYLVLAVADKTVITDAGTTLLVMAGLFGVLGWADLWQTLRTPAYRALDAGWRDDSRLFGRSGVGVGRGVRRLAGIVLAYATTAFAGIVLTTTGFAAVSSTIWTSTAAWGEFYLYGIDQLTTVSGHTAVVPGVAVVVLIASAIALADGIRAATETGQELGESAPGAVSALGGGG
jgi:peptide/nickel transport system permease protein